MTDSIVYWVALALLVFWLVGARNRLVRLRSAALQSYGALDAALQRQLEFVQGRSEAGFPGVADETAIAHLRAAIPQMGALLSATRRRPLDPGALGALATALHILLGAWLRLHPQETLSFEADGTLARPGPPPAAASAAETPLVWPEPSAAAEMARGQFNRDVAQYNAAVHQFPAQLAAWIFGLRTAAPLI